MLSERFRVYIDVHFSGENVEGIGIVYNLALRGALIETKTPVKTGDRLDLSVMLPDQDDPVELPAAVRWVRGHRMGVEFFKMEVEAFQQLTGYLIGVLNANQKHLKAA